MPVNSRNDFDWLLLVVIVLSIGANLLQFFALREKDDNFTIERYESQLADSTLVLKLIQNAPSVSPNGSVETTSKAALLNACMFGQSLALRIRETPLEKRNVVEEVRLIDGFLEFIQAHVDTSLKGLPSLNAALAEFEKLSLSDASLRRIQELRAEGY